MRWKCQTFDGLIAGGNLSFELVIVVMWQNGKVMGLHSHLRNPVRSTRNWGEDHDEQVVYRKFTGVTKQLQTFYDSAVPFWWLHGISRLLLNICFQSHSSGTWLLKADRLEMDASLFVQAVFRPGMCWWFLCQGGYDTKNNLMDFHETVEGWVREEPF